MFCLLQLPNAGDDLQAIKKGIVEIADLVVINKADIDKQATAVVRAQWRNALHMLRSGLAQLVAAGALPCRRCTRKASSISGQQVEKYQAALKPTGEFDAKRQHQALAWMWQLIDSGLRQHFRPHPRVQENLPAFTRSVEAGRQRPRLPPRTRCSTISNIRIQVKS